MELPMLLFVRVPTLESVDDIKFMQVAILNAL